MPTLTDDVPPAVSRLAEDLDRHAQTTTERATAARRADVLIAELKPLFDSDRDLRTAGLAVLSGRRPGRGRPYGGRPGPARVAQILDVLGRAGRPLTVSEIAAEVGLLDDTVRKAMTGNYRGHFKASRGLTPGGVTRWEPTINLVTPDPETRLPSSSGPGSGRPPAADLIADFLTGRPDTSPATVDEIADATGLTTGRVRSVLAYAEVGAGVPRFRCARQDYPEGGRKWWTLAARPRRG